MVDFVIAYNTTVLFVKMDDVLDHTTVDWGSTSGQVDCQSFHLQQLGCNLDTLKRSSYLGKSASQIYAAFKKGRGYCYDAPTCRT